MADERRVVEARRAGLARGVLSFPLTAFVESAARAKVDAGPGALSACCGTGEFFSLSGDFPLVELRDGGHACAVSLVKAAARLHGARVGPVRVPLTDPTAEHTAQLPDIFPTGLELVGVTDGLS